MVDGRMAYDEWMMDVICMDRVSISEVGAWSVAIGGPSFEIRAPSFNRRA